MYDVFCEPVGSPLHKGLNLLISATRAPAAQTDAEWLLKAIEDSQAIGELTVRQLAVLEVAAGRRLGETAPPAPVPKLTPGQRARAANAAAGEQRRLQVAAALRQDSTATNAALARAHRVSRSTVAAVRAQLRKAAEIR